MRADRRTALKVAAVTIAGLGARDASAEATVIPLSQGTVSKTDFDYFVGRWRVEHRRLRRRLIGSNDWETFDGRTHCQQMFDGLVNLNESVSYRNGRTSYGLGLRALDVSGGRWADWTLSASDLSKIDAPQYGRFAGGVGIFYSRESFEGRPVLVRGQFMPVGDAEARWEQAFSTDAGVAWETNWIMRYLREV